jgi:hypothetical protein
MPEKGMVAGTINRRFLVPPADLIASSSECVIFDLPASLLRIVDGCQRRRPASFVSPRVPRRQPER